MLTVYVYEWDIKTGSELEDKPKAATESLIKMLIWRQQCCNAIMLYDANDANEPLNVSDYVFMEQDLRLGRQKQEINS